MNSRFKRYVERGIWKKENLFQSLERWEKMYSERIAIVEEEEALTYKQLLEKVNCRANGFLNQGLKKGDCVIVQLPNGIEFVITIFALFKCGIIPVMALPAHREKEILGMVQISKAQGYIFQTNYMGYCYETIAKALIKEYKGILLLAVGEQEKYLDLKAIDLETHTEIEQPEYDETALLLLSGGTTGISKLIPRRHTDYLYVAEESAKTSGMSTESVFIAAIPIAHNFALGTPGVIGTLAVGGRIVICSVPSPDEIIPLIEEEKGTIISLVPALANLCADFLEMDDLYDISSLQVLQIGGSCLECSVAQRLMRVFGCKLQQIYGIAEGLFCSTSLDDSDDIICTCQGKILSDELEYKILDSTGEDSDEGELLIRGPYTITGYFNLPDINKESFTKEGYFCTGDKVKKTKEGNFQVKGRTKETINRAGEKIMPAEIESYLLEFPGIREVSVLGIPDEKQGEIVCAYVMADIEVKYEEVRKFFLNKGVTLYKIPDMVKQIDIWPLTSVGKIDKKKLAAMAME